MLGKASKILSLHSWLREILLYFVWINPWVSIALLILLALLRLSWRSGIE